jgi:hypothetical protein
MTNVRYSTKRSFVFSVTTVGSIDTPYVRRLLQHGSAH